MNLSLASTLTHLSSLGIHTIDLSSHLRGCSHDIYVVETLNHQKWSLRAAKHKDAKVSDRSLAILGHMAKTQPSLAVPAVICTAADYCILSYIEGVHFLEWMTRVGPDISGRCNFLDGVAGFFYGLWTCETTSLTTEDQRITYREWLTAEVDLGIRRAINNTVWGDPKTFLHRRTMIDDLVRKEMDCEKHSMLIRHGDLNAQNILVNDGALAGIIDWDWAMLVPAPSAIQHPLFMANIPGFNHGEPVDSLDFVADREYLEAAIRDMSPDGPALADLLATSWERQFFEQALRNRRINAEYVRLRLPDGIDCETLRGQLEAFLAGNVDMVGESKIVELQMQLE